MYGNATAERKIAFPETNWWDWVLNGSTTGQQRGPTPGDPLLKRYLANTQERGAPMKLR